MAAVEVLDDRASAPDGGVRVHGWHWLSLRGFFVDILTATTLNVLSSSVAPLAADVAQEILGVLRNRFSEAKEEYKAKSAETLRTPIENKRRERLDELSQLQTKAILDVTDQRLLQKISLMLIELTIETYESNVEQELDLIERRTKQIQSVLDRDEKERNFRKKIRFLAVAISVLAFILLFTVAILLPVYVAGTDYIIPILSIPITVLLWSAIGSFTALLYRFNKAGDVELQDPLRWLVTRPITGIMMGVLAYLALKAGFLAMSQTNTSIATNELIWLISFLAGFSDTFSDGILKRLMGQLGNDKNEDLINYSTLSNFNLLELLKPWPKKQQANSENGTVTNENEPLVSESEPEKPSSRSEPANESKTTLVEESRGLSPNKS